jgi:hypothetical protein
MLRIGIQQGAQSTQFTVEGTLVYPWVNELERCWQSSRLAEPRQQTVVNLSAVTSIDASGIDLLARMRMQGVSLIPIGLLMRAIVERIEADLAPKATKLSIKI